MRKLPDRVWRLPRREGDEAADEGIGRILALSDGVFAIAVTLLILDIAVPVSTSTRCRMLCCIFGRVTWPTR